MIAFLTNARDPVMHTVMNPPPLLQTLTDAATVTAVLVHDTQRVK